MKILLLEDEPRAAEHLAKMVKKNIAGAHIITILPSVHASISWFLNNDMPDLIMMDINLADGNCFSIFEIVHISAPIIFCTAYDEYALEAFQTNGFSYLLKPISEPDLIAALDKLKALRTLPVPQSEYKKISLRNETFKSRFLIHAGCKIFPVSTSDIACFMMQEHGLKVFLSNCDNYFIDFTVSELDTLLNPAQFFRISRQAIISKQAITAATKTSRNARVKLEQFDIELSISRERTKPFRKWLEN